MKATTVTNIYFLVKFIVLVSLSKEEAVSLKETSKHAIMLWH